MFGLPRLSLPVLLGASLIYNTIPVQSESLPNTYDYIVVGSGPGGGPLAANLAIAGHSVLLLEAGSDRGDDLNQQVAGFVGRAIDDPAMRWDFFVKHHASEELTKEFLHLTWLTPEGRYYVGTEPPPNSTVLGVLYPRTGTLGGCSTHNAMLAVLPSDSDWQIVADLTNDQSWSPANMKQYFVRLERNNYADPGTPGHGFDGYLDISLNDERSLDNRPDFLTFLRQAAKSSGQDPEDILSILQRDLNTASPDRDQQTGVFGFPAHRTLDGRRSSARTRVVGVANAKTADNKPRYKLSVGLNSLVTKVLFDTTGRNKMRPKAIGVEFLEGQSIYSADPRHNATVKGNKKKAFARREVIVSAGVFNSPQILKLSGIGPKEELSKFGIPVVVDLPGVGRNLQDHNEFAIVSRAGQKFSNPFASCTFGAPGDPCMQAWQAGTGPYALTLTNAIQLKSSVASERDIFMSASTNPFQGYWPDDTVNVVPRDPPNTVGFSIVKMHPTSHEGLITSRSNDPRDMPEINFRFFEGDSNDNDLQAIEDAVTWGRGVLDSLPAPIAPVDEVLPCGSDRNCDVKASIRAQTWSHHATSSCSIGADDDPLAVLDSKFRVRGTRGLRVVDGSAFPRCPGSFPVIATFMLGEKASDIILQDA